MGELAKDFGEWRQYHHEQEEQPDSKKEDARQKAKGAEIPGRARAKNLRYHIKAHHRARVREKEMAILPQQIPGHE